MGCCGVSESQADVAQSSRPSSRHHLVNQQPVAHPELALHMAHQLARRPDSPPLSAGYAAPSDYDLSAGVMPVHARQTSRSSRDEGKLVIAVDFGTTFSGVAYGSSRFAAGRVQQILKWPRSLEKFRKIPTCLLYDEHGRLLDWGLQAKNARLQPGLLRFEWFKLFLEPRALRDEPELDPRLPSLPLGKTPSDLISDFLRSLWTYCREEITRDMGAIADLDSADVWLTVPAAWDARGCAVMRAAAISAGLVQSAYPGDTAWRDRLKIITEPEAAAVHCAHLTGLHQLRPSQNFIVCDAGGGTVDLAVYKIIGDPAHLEIAEIAARSGANCGSLYLDIRFRNLVKTLLVDHPSHCDAASLAYFMNSFSEADKLTYKGREDDDTGFYFTCFDVQDTADDPSIGLVNGQLGIPGSLLREAVFDPVVDQVINLISTQLSVSPPIDALLLVGGFSGSTYLKTRIEERFGGRISTLARPPDCDTATLRGAARYGLARRPLVSQLVVPRSYVMKVKLPAEPEDRIRRPGYVQYNDARVEVCERLQYLVRKGAIVQKGRRVKTQFCKFSKTRDDSTFTATLYTFDSEATTTIDTARYADEARLRPVCDWRVDLRGLRGWGADAPIGGFYTDFEIALELDGPTVGGTLIYRNEECGRVVFDFRE
ncbi:actin-like ATPase domain-containing protein [Mycena amicta]|nr:actin-like ATPase domain-containing protein [Mycena amicta]